MLEDEDDGSSRSLVRPDILHKLNIVRIPEKIVRKLSGYRTLSRALHIDSKTCRSNLKRG